MDWNSNAKIETDDFWGDLLEGYIKPHRLLQDEIQIKQIEAAVELLKEFKDSAEENDIVEYN